MTEVMRPERADVVRPSALPTAVESLTEWAEKARAAAELAVSLCKTSFVPEGFRNKPEEAAAAILSGAEVGLSPVAALRSYDVISGVAAPRAIALRAIVQSHGHHVWIEESTETRAVACGQRHGSTQVERSVWTMDRARKLGLANKHNWKAQPGAMLVARATSEVCRLVAADAILGIGYSIEELVDDAEPSTVGEPTSAKRPARRTAQRKPVEPAPEPVPELEPVEVSADQGVPAEPGGLRTTAQTEPAISPPSAYSPEGSRPAGADEPITEKQMKKLHACYRDAGVTTRDEGLTFAIGVIDRQISSTKELTKREAARVIDALDTQPPDSEPVPEPPEPDGWQ